MSAAERRLYAALISDLPTLLPACESWEDHLWAYLQAAMESRLDGLWRDSADFWAEQDQLSGNDVAAPGDDRGVDEIFARLAESGREDVQ